MLWSGDTPQRLTVQEPLITWITSDDDFIADGIQAFRQRNRPCNMCERYSFARKRTRLALAIIASEDIPAWPEVGKYKHAQSSETGNRDALTARRNLPRRNQPVYIAAERHAAAQGRRRASFVCIQECGTGLQLFG